MEGEATSGPQLRKPWNRKQLQPGCLTVATYKNLKQNHQTQTHHTAQTHMGQNRGKLKGNKLCKLEIYETAQTAMPPNYEYKVKMKNSISMSCDIVNVCYTSIYWLHLQRFKVHDNRGNAFLRNNGNHLTSNAALHP